MGRISDPVAPLRDEVSECVRILGEVRNEYADLLRRADDIFIAEPGLVTQRRTMRRAPLRAAQYGRHERAPSGGP